MLQKQTYKCILMDILQTFSEAINLPMHNKSGKRKREGIQTSNFSYRDFPTENNLRNSQGSVHNDIYHNVICNNNKEEIQKQHK